MASTPNLDKTSKDLSFKIFDPVTDGKDDGRVYSKELRLSYINRAYGKLIRTLEIIHPKIVKVFKDYYVTVNAGNLTENANGSTSSAGYGDTYTLPQPYDVYDAYYYPAEEEGISMERADYLDPDNYLPSKLGLNDLYSATATTRKWSLIDNKVVFLPQSGVQYWGVVLFCRNYFPTFIHDGTEDLFIPNDYMDILITMAAIEAMSDRGMQGKYQLYTATLNTQLQMIAQGKMAENIEEKGQK